MAVETMAVETMALKTLALKILASKTSDVADRAGRIVIVIMAPLKKCIAIGS
ncbi:MAG: hypothetical protein ACJATP_000123 [Candidatus Azotimanducaceae bacterium]|jgi:hypothetical protein